MYTYSSDGRRRETVYASIAVVALGLAWGLGALFSYLSFAPPWWLDTPAVLGFYGAVWRLYDQYLWRVPIGSPNLGGATNYRGKWRGQIQSDYAGGIAVDAHLSIMQTATSLLVTLTTENSRSDSSMAMVRTEGALQGLHYHYFNEPRPLAQATMNAHRGYAHLRLDQSGQSLVGDYRNDGRRGTSGRMTFQRC